SSTPSAIATSDRSSTRNSSPRQAVAGRMASLTGKTALVTGASRGIGRAIAERLASDGATVAVHYGSNEAAAAETVDAIRAAGGEAFPIRAPLGVDNDVDTLFAALEEGLDGRPLDILVN